MRKIKYEFPVQLNIPEAIHTKIEKSIAGIKITRYSEEASQEQLSKRKQSEIYLNDIYSIIRKVSYAYIKNVKMYYELTSVLQEEKLVTCLPKKQEDVGNMIVELRNNIALTNSKRSIHAKEQEVYQVSKEKHSQLQHRFEQLSLNHATVLKQLSVFKKKDERKVQNNTENEATKRLMAYKDPIQEMYNKMADFQNWSKTTLKRQSGQQQQKNRESLGKDKEEQYITELESLRSTLSNQKEAFSHLQKNIDQMQHKHMEQKIAIRHTLLQQKENRDRTELEVQRLTFQKQALQEQNKQLRQQIKLQKQQIELLRRNDRKNRKNYGNLQTIQSQIEGKNNQFYSLLSKSEQQRYKMTGDTRKLKRQLQLLQERCLGYQNLLKQE